MYTNTYHTALKPAALLIVLILVAWLGLGQANGPEHEDEQSELDCKTECGWKDSVCYDTCRALAGYQSAEKELKSVFQQAIEDIRSNDTMSADMRDKWEKLFRKSHKTWIEYRKLDCSAVEYEWFGGSGMEAAKWACYLTSTIQRAEELRSRYLHDENDDYLERVCAKWLQQKSPSYPKQNAIDPIVRDKDEINKAALEFAQTKHKNVQHIKTCYSKSFRGWYVLLYAKNRDKFDIHQYSWDMKTKEWMPMYTFKGITAKKFKQLIGNEVDDDKCFILKQYQPSS